VKVLAVEVREDPGIWFEGLKTSLSVIGLQAEAILGDAQRIMIDTNGLKGSLRRDCRRSPAEVSVACQ